MKTGQKNQGQFGTVKGMWASCEVTVSGHPLLPGASRRICNHSPSGFNWGYGGSGPAQLALALLLKLGRSESYARNRYQDFKWDIVAQLPQSDFELSVREVYDWIREHP